LLNPIDFLAFVQILQYMKLSSLLYTSQVYFFNHGFQCFRPLELEGVTSVVDYVKRANAAVKNQDDPPPWVAEN